MKTLATWTDTKATLETGAMTSTVLAATERVTRYVKGVCGLDPAAYGFNVPTGS